MGRSRRQLTRCSFFTRSRGSSVWSWNNFEFPGSERKSAHWPPRDLSHLSLTPSFTSRTINLKHHLFCGPRLFGFNLKTPLVLWAKIVWLPLPQCLAWTRTKASEKFPEFRTGIFTCQEPSQEKPGLLPKTFNYGSYLKDIFSSRDPCVKVGKSGGL